MQAQASVASDRLGYGLEYLCLALAIAARYYPGSNMIKSFRNAAAEAAWQRRFVKGIPHEIIKAANRKLMQIHNARSLNDLRAPPGNRLERLSADRKGQHSIRINDQWRICFRWRDGDAHDVEIVDYH